MSKKSNNTSKVNKVDKKKPLYKQWWFWLIVVFVIIIAGESSSSDNEGTDFGDDIKVATDCYDSEKIEVIDLSSMSANDIKVWTKEKGLEYKTGAAEYSNSVSKGKLISQSIKPGTVVCKESTLTVIYSLGKEPTNGQKNALVKAKSYSDNLHMSKAKIYKQLISEYGEGFSEEDAKYAIDNLEANYKENALAKAKSYQDNMHMSKSRIYNQLTAEYGEAFTAEEAQYAVDRLSD